MQYSNEELQEKFIQNYIYDNMYKDFKEDIERMENLVDIANIIETHFDVLESCSSNESIRVLAETCYKTDQSLLTLFFQAQNMPEEERRRLIINSNFTQTQKLLAMGYSVLGIKRIDEWLKSTYLDRSKLNPWEAMIEFKSIEEAMEYFKFDPIGQLSGMGSWERLKNGHLLFIC